MHPETMKHKASMWEGEFGESRHITDVYWEGDITQAELISVADQITTAWETIDLELDPAHPCHGKTYRLQKSWPSAQDEAYALRNLEAEDELQGTFVWVHACKHVFDDAGEMEDDAGRPYHRVFNTVMFCVEFISFDDIAAQCDENFGIGHWDEYDLYLDDELPESVVYCQ
jgi:hypothetical protein